MIANLLNVDRATVRPILALDDDMLLLVRPVNCASGDWHPWSPMPNLQGRSKTGLATSRGSPTWDFLHFSIRSLSEFVAKSTCACNERDAKVKFCSNLANLVDPSCVRFGMRTRSLDFGIVPVEKFFGATRRCYRVPCWSQSSVGDLNKPRPCNPAPPPSVSCHVDFFLCENKQVL
jgi:hypothetical protein